MAWRTVAITNPASLRVLDSQLVIAQEAEVALSLEDIAVLLLESPQVSLSSGTLARLADAGTVVLVCGPKHVPVLACHPYASHSRLSGIQRLQLATSLPFRKRCWQRIIQAKIENQAEACRLSGCAGFARVAAYADKVTSGDSGNVESAAAREHFAQLFGPGWARSGSDPINSALDYGYAILRAALVRSLAAHGLVLSQGVHHASELNPFNLADDFLEPYRPAADLYASHLAAAGVTEFTKQHRAELAGVLGCEVLVDGKRQSILNAAELTAASYVSACREGQASLLRLPQVFALTEHRYE